MCSAHSNSRCINQCMTIDIIYYLWYDMAFATTSYRDYEREARQLVRQLLQTSLERIHHEQSQSQVAIATISGACTVWKLVSCVCPRVNH